ncbi:ABC-type antimicrobial peptide transport system, permease component [Candidatus Rhodobacter oscarellae]|uniref:ABC-type antimicrobial peptide transport system, permease component n=1 Tax=Candidatus Rhodobacter oscarellae TaxID=1675527 RepID=A0A0J9E6I6_9RHOB|nr:ABC transporter permease [Candidatus Rhodobacter lobularis]KMW57439.1 ABC-type antimicrobial peptide transport system, permease component [Candidatus Rhodobacter lobularis]
MWQNFWQELSTNAQNALMAAGLVLPVLLCWVLVRRGFRPAPLVRAILWRYRWANAMFTLLIAISVGMGLGLIAQERGLRKGMAQAADKFDIVITAPGSELTMMLASVFLRATDTPLLDGPTYNEIANHPRVELAAPLAFGDSVGEAPVVGTTASFVTHLSDGRIEGRMFATPYEAVIGAAVPMQIGDSTIPAHGRGAAAIADAHADEITVVGRMARTGSPWDNAVLTPVEGVWLVHGLADGHAPGSEATLGEPFDAEYFPGTPAVIVRAGSLAAAYALRSEFTREAETMAFFPGAVLANLYRVMGDVRQAMSIMATVTQALVAASVLLGLFILVRLFQRQMALLRALGAPGRFIFAVIWSYCATLLVAGAALGAVLGLGATWVLGRIVTARTDILVEASLGWTELHLGLGFVTLASLLSLLPAWAQLRQPVVSHLRG